MDFLAIDKKDIKEVVRIHKSAFKGFFLTELGDDFLSLYYKSVLNYRGAILLGCFEDDKLLGFCAATILSNGFNARLIKSNLINFYLIGLKILFTKPNAIIRLFHNFSKKSSEIDDGLYSELLSIGVDPNCQGKGVGKILLTVLESLLKDNNISKLSLTTDFYDNDKAISFYKSLGYSVFYDFVTYPNRRMYRMIKNLIE